MEEHSDPDLRAANLAFAGRRVTHTATRFASIQLRDVAPQGQSDRYNLAWEIAAVSAVSLVAIAGVLALWFV